MSHDSYEGQNGWKEKRFGKYFTLGISTNIGVMVGNCVTYVHMYIFTWGSNFQTYQHLLTGSYSGRSKQNSGFRRVKVLGW